MEGKGFHVVEDEELEEEAEDFLDGLDDLLKENSGSGTKASKNLRSNLDDIRQRIKQREEEDPYEGWTEEQLPRVLRPRVREEMGQRPVAQDLQSTVLLK